MLTCMPDEYFTLIAASSPILNIEIKFSDNISASIYIISLLLNLSPHTIEYYYGVNEKYVMNHLTI